MPIVNYNLSENEIIKVVDHQEEYQKSLQEVGT